MTDLDICDVRDCHKPADDWFVCRDCACAFERDILEQVAWLLDDLELVITGQVKYAPKVGDRSSETPMPMNEAASNARGELLMQLDTTCRLIAEENQIEAEYHDGPSAAAWLCYRISMIRLHAAGGDLIDQITGAFKKALWLVDRPRSKQYLGDCKDHERDDDLPVCQGSIYALEGKPEARCETCGRWWPKDELREWLFTQLETRIMTAAEIARIGAYLGLSVKREAVRKLINQWARRGRIEVVSLQSEGRQVDGYRFGDAHKLLLQDESRRAAG